MRIRYGWELALAALLVIEIVAFGAINRRMLDLNMLLFSTSDFICIGIVALPLTMVIVSGGIDISIGSTISVCAIALGVLFEVVWRCAGDTPDLTARRIVRADQRRINLSIPKLTRW
ncbi:ABC transporter permease subunit [Escherichia coli]